MREAAASFVLNCCAFSGLVVAVAAVWMRRMRSVGICGLFSRLTVFGIPAG